MDAEKVIKSSQEQAVAAWLNQLNQIRLDRLQKDLKQETTNFKEAIKAIEDARCKINWEIIGHNRGGTKGVHGYIAEAAQCGVGNARKLILGEKAGYEWVNDNGPVDLRRDGIEIQQKFVQADGRYSLGAAAKHLEKYPDFLKSHGKYQVPKDFYEKIKSLLEMPEKEAGKLPNHSRDGELSYGDWKKIHEFFDQGDISFSDIEPSDLTYEEVQAGQIDTTLDREKKDLKNTNEQRKKQAYEESKPGVAEGAKAAAVAAAIEGGTAFCIAISKKLRSGKKLNDFTKEDWGDILVSTGKGGGKGALRGAGVYILSNYTATPASVASAIVTASFSVAEQAYRLRSGNISETDFIVNSEILCLDASVSALSAILGQVAIPVPILGAVIGNSVGTMMYQISKDHLSEKEQTLLAKYAEDQAKLDASCAEEYQSYMDMLSREFTAFMSLVDAAFSPDIVKALNGSVQMARALEVPENEILDTQEKRWTYFMN